MRNKTGSVKVEVARTTFYFDKYYKKRLNVSKDTFACFIDMKKAFDWVDRDLLFFKFLNYNITGKIYWAIKSMYTNTQSCIQLQQTFTNWFSVLNGVKQGDNLSPSLFALYINDLVQELNSIGCGIRIETYVINILLYADDIVLVAENENILQKLLDKLYEWCSR